MSRRVWQHSALGALVLGRAPGTCCHTPHPSHSRIIRYMLPHARP